MRRISLILIVIILASTSLFAWEHENHNRLEQKKQEHKIYPRKSGNGEQREFGMKLEMLEELDLSDAQLEKMGSIKTSHRKQQIRLKADLEILQIDKKEALKKKQFADAKKVNAEISKLKLQMSNAKIDQQAAIWDELTEKQQEKAEATMKNLHKNRKGKIAKKNKRKMK